MPPVSAYHAAPWHDFFVGQASAAAALTGLIFVAVSLNLQKILQYPHLPSRAAVALLFLLELLIVAMVALIPDQSRTALGVELLVLGAGFWLAILTRQARNVATIDAEDRPDLRRLQLRWIVVGQCATLPAIVAAATLLTHAGGGLYWLPVSTVLLFLAGVGQGWVLLVEIQR